MRGGLLGVGWRRDSALPSAVMVLADIKNTSKLLD